ncbi:MAG: T9SS type A sorting domain-containing protein [Bacteroidia bacterium]|nr:T9SS type A sorting domain-containing protein [Bacteroidia bacterium]
MKTELRDKRELYNAMGQFILSTQANEIDVSRCSKGVYYLKCGIFIKKIIID